MSQTKQMKRDKFIANRKDTRWDRIRKRHAGPVLPIGMSLKTEAVKRFIDMDFIGKDNERILNGDQNIKPQLNPALVMDLRHEMFRKKAQKLPLATLAHKRSIDTCVAHNLAVEERHLVNELNKYRQQLQKHNQRNRRDMHKAERALQLDNAELRRSLEATSNHIADFYAAPIEALQQIQELCSSLQLESGMPTIQDSQIDNHENSTKTAIEEEEENVDNIQNITQTELSDNEKQLLQITVRTPSPLTTTDEIVQRVRAATDDQAGVQLRCVRFEEDVEVRKYERESSICSNTSDGIDSVISDLAEEALVELQLEEQAMEQAKLQKDDINQMLQLENTEQTVEIESLKVEGESAATVVNTDELLVIQRMILPKRQAKAICDNADLSDEDKDEHSESTSNQEQNLIIEQLFQARAHTNVPTLRKYFLKWIHYTTIEKIERENTSGKNDRVHLINAFLDKIRKEKVRYKKQELCTNSEGILIESKETTDGTNKQPPANTKQIAKKFQNKIKMQQDIIDLQRLKLERQERMIMELKLNKLSDESKEARQEIKNELKAVIRSGDPKAKAKAKCLQIIGELRDTDDDELTRLRGKALLVPKFLQQMQERALERSVRHEQARQRRLQQEAEREAVKIAAEEAKRLEDEEAKHMRIEALKEKRRLEKMAKILKERERQRAIENQRKALDYNRRLLLNRVGMEGFKRLLQRKRDYQRKCEIFRRQHYKRHYFVAWKDYYVLLCEEKQQRAELFHAQLLQRQALSLWLNHLNEQRSKYHVAVDWHDMRLSERMFTRWFGYTKRMLMIEETKMRQATSHHEWHLKWKVLDCWQRLPQILQLERETEERRQRWRMKIWELLPDYTPHTDDLTWH